MDAADTAQPPALVGERDALLDELATAVPAPPAPLIYALQPAGMGRTTILAQLRERLEGEGRAVLHVPLASYRPAAAADDESGARERELRVKERSLVSYRRILEDLAAELPGVEGFAARAPELVRGARSESELDLAKDELRNAFLDELERGAAEPLALLLDDYSSVAGDELGAWLVELIENAGARRPVLAVVTATGSLGERDTLPPGTRVRELAPFTPEESAAYLDLTASGTQVAPDWPAAVDRWSGGYPAAVALAAHLAPQWSQRPDILARDEPPRELAGRTKPLFDLLMRSTESDEERAALEVAGIVARFDGVLLRSLVADLGLVAPPDLEQRLARYPFVVAVDEPREQSEYRVRPFVRHVAALELRSLPPRGTRGGVSRLTEIRDRAGWLYLERVQEEAQSRGGAYRSWEQLERPEVQETLLEFLHHVAGHEDRRVARYWLTWAYFTAFWWCCWYLESPFCQDLLDKWAATQPRGEDADFLDALRLFHVSYPPYFEWFMGRARGDWEAVDDALYKIRALTGLDRGRLSDDERQLRAIMDVFLAHSLRRRRPGDLQIDRLYESARAGFGSSKDYEWCVAWVVYDEADTRLERDAPEEAEERAREGLRLATGRDAPEEDLDREVIANLHRVLGDAAFTRGRHARAFEDYGRALFRAWEFQALPDVGDDLTRAFYEELTTRVRERIEHVRARDPGEAERATAVLAELWAPYFAEVAEPAGARLHPRLPEREDLVDGSDYVRRVRRLGGEIEARAAALRAASGRPSLGGLLRRAVARDHDGPAPGSVVAGRAALFAVPAGPVEAPDLFAPAEHPLWPGSWRTFPQEWREVAEGEATSAEVRTLVRTAIDELPEGWRLVLERRDIDGWTREEVARRFGIAGNEQTVILHHARARVRRALAPHFERAAT